MKNKKMTSITILLMTLLLIFSFEKTVVYATQPTNTAESTNVINSVSEDDQENDEIINDINDLYSDVFSPEKTDEYISEDDSTDLSEKVEIESEIESDDDNDVRSNVGIEIFSGTGTGTIDDPYLLDITDYTSLSNGYTISLATDGISATFTLTDGNSYYTLFGGTSTSPSTNSVIVGADNITVNLNNVYITTKDVLRAPFNTQNYNVTLNALENTQNSFRNNDAEASGYYSAGILHSPKNAASSTNGTLTILGKGKLMAYGGHFGAGIGGSKESNGGMVDILGDIDLTSNGGYRAPGIGGSQIHVSSGPITIHGNATVTATGSEGSAGIGGGYLSLGADLKIYENANVTAKVKNNNGAAGIGGGSRAQNYKTEIYGNAVVNAYGGNYCAGIGGASLSSGGTIIIRENAKVTAKSYSKGAGIGGGSGGVSGTISISGNSVVEATGGALAAGIGGGESGGGESITISENANVTAQGGRYAAGIGGGYSGKSGTISIDGGMVTSQGGEYAPGIGSGASYDYGIKPGTITISKGVVNAIGGTAGAGIGGGQTSGNTITPTITILGGTITATGGNKVLSTDLSGGSGIGSGGVRVPLSSSQVTGANIKMSELTISGGTVFANGVGGAPGIGIPDEFDVATRSYGKGIISSGNVYSVGDATENGDMPIFNGQTVEQQVYQKLLAIEGLSNEESITDFSVVDASWYKVLDSKTFVLDDGIKGQAYVSVWLPETQEKKIVQANIGSTIYQGNYIRPTYNTTHTLYKPVSLNIEVVPEGTGEIISINGTQVDNNQSIQTIFPGDIIVIKATHNKGYIFNNWEIAGVALSEDELKQSSLTFEIEQENVTIKPIFTPEVYTIEYELDDGENAKSNPDTYTFGVGVDSFSTASKTGYNFDGWFTDTTFTEKVESISTSQTDDIKLYAKFTVKEYTITYLLDGGINNNTNPITYKYGTGTILQEPTKEGYIFGGWVIVNENGEDTGVIISEIKDTELNNITLKALWTASPSSNNSSTSGTSAPVDSSSSTSTATQNSQTNSSSPKTGDTSALDNMLILLSVSSFALCFILFFAYKIKNKK